MRVHLRHSLLVLGLLVGGTGSATAQSLPPELLAALRLGAADVAVPSGSVDVPLHGAPTLPLVDVRLDGRGPYRFLIDLGSNVTIVRRDVVDSAGLAVAFDRERGAIVRADSLSIGDAVFRDVVMGEYADLDVDGVLGFNVLGKAPFAIDYPGARFVYGRAEVDAGDPAYVLESRMPYLPARVGERDVLLNLDTGATGGITVPAAWEAWLPIDGSPRPGPRVWNQQTGTYRVRLARLATDVRVTGGPVLETPEVLLDPTVEDAWIGSGILRDYVVAVDPGLGRLRLTAAPDTARRAWVPALADRILDRYADYGFGGVALVALGDTIAFAEGYGLADRESGFPHRASTVIPYQSLTKPFTAAAMVRLAERGDVALDDPLGSVVSGLPDPVASIRLHQLLTHTSGLPENLPEGVTTRRDVLEALRAVKLESEPGTDFEYSNYGYAVLAAVIEGVAGVPYRRFVEEDVVAPAGDLAIGFWRESAWPDSLVATGYTGTLGSGRATEAHEPSAIGWRWLGGGGLWGSLPDLHAWARALREGRVVGPEWVERIFTPYASDYGYGWFLWETDRGTTEVIHGGDGDGFQTYLAFFPGDDFALAVATNDQRGWRGPVYGALVDLVVEGEVPELPPATIAPDPERLDRLAGTYEVAGGRFEIEAVPEGLLVGAVGQRAVTLLTSADAEAAERLAERNRGSEAFVRALVEGDSIAVREALEPSGRPESFFRVWDHLAEGRAPTGFEVLGTVPSRANRDVTFVRMRFGDETGTLRLVWRPILDGWGTGGEMPQRVFRPIRGGGFASYDLFTRSTVRLRFETDEEGRAEIVFPAVESPEE